MLNSKVYFNHQNYQKNDNTNTLNKNNVSTSLLEKNTIKTKYNISESKIIDANIYYKKSIDPIFRVSYYK